MSFRAQRHLISHTLRDCTNTRCRLAALLAQRAGGVGGFLDSGIFAQCGQTGLISALYRHLTWSFASKGYCREFQGSSLFAAPITAEVAGSQAQPTSKAKAKTKEQPKSSYRAFVSQQWHAYRQEGDSIGNIMRKLAAKWKEMSPEEKLKYEKKTSKEKGPKQLTKYANFVKMEYSKYRQSEDETLIVVAGRLSAAWKTMSETDKSKYIVERTVKAKPPVAKARRPVVSGFGYFIDYRMGEPRPVGERTADAVKRIAAEWRGLTDDQRKQWNDKVANKLLENAAGR